MFSIFRRASRCERDAWIHHVAQQCAAHVKRQLPSDIAAMSAAELRGYVRAVLVPIVNEHALPRGDELPRPDDWIAGALEASVHLAMQGLSSPPVIAIPAPHVRQRAA